MFIEVIVINRLCSNYNKLQYNRLWDCFQGSANSLLFANLTIMQETCPFMLENCLLFILTPTVYTYKTIS